MAVTCGYGEELSGSINAGNFLTSGRVYWLASQEGLCSMEKVSKFEVASEFLEDLCTLRLVITPISRRLCVVNSSNGNISILHYFPDNSKNSNFFFFVNFRF